MPQYKLTYFKGRGRGEGARLLFAQAGVDYEDCRLTREEFQAIKADVTKFPLGQLPVLNVDGHPTIPQSNAIQRHLARKFDMYGKNEEEATRIDVACECVDDIFNLVVKIFMEKDETKKAELKKNFVETDSVTIFTAMCKALTKNTKGNGFFIGDKMSLADIVIFNMLDLISEMMPTLTLADKYPALKEFDTRMRAEPKIAAWLAKRPADN